MSSVQTIITKSNTDFHRRSLHRLLLLLLICLGELLATSGAFAGNVRPPASLYATSVSSSQINLKWTDKSVNELGTKIERAPSSSGPWSQIGTVGGNVTSFSNTGLSPSTTYCYRVRSYNSTENSLYSAVAAATTKAGACSYTLSSTSASFGSGSASGYIGVTTTTGCPWSASSNVSWITTSSSGSGSGTAYYSVAANTSTTSRSGTLTVAGKLFSVTQAGAAASSPDYTAPSTPANLTATAVSTSQINLSWNVSTDTGGSGLAGYRIYKSGQWISTVTGTSTAATSLPASTLYCYTVAAIDHAGNISPQSNQACATTLATSPQPPATPTGLTATAVSSSQINLSWAASAGATSYAVYRAGIFQGTVTTTSFYSTGLLAGTGYCYTVAASNSAGSSPQCLSRCATTLVATVLPPAPPTGLTAAAVSCSQINLAWNASSGATSYAVYRGTTLLGTTTSTSYASGGLLASISYCYTVRASNSSGTSGASGQACATTAADFPPSITLSYPTSGATLSGTVTLRVNAADSGCSPVTRVDFYCDGATTPIATATTAPFSAFWDSARVANGTHTMSAKATDSAGNTTQTGSTSFSVSNGVVLPNPGEPGTLAWVRNPSPQSGLNVNGMATDHYGNTVVAGKFFGTVDLGSGVVLSSSGGASDGFVFKYNSQGVPLWAKALGGTGHDGAAAVTVDGQDNVIVTGNFYSASLDFGGGILINAGGTSTPDAFVVKLSPSGQHVWSKRFGSLSVDTPTAVATDASGNVFVASQGSLTVDFGSGISRTGAGGIDIALVKFSGATGATMWGKLFGGSFSDYVNGLTVDRAGDIVITGRFAGGDLGGGATAATGIMVAKYSGLDGSYRWSRIPGGGTGMGYGITVDPTTGIIIAAGNVNGDANFGGGSISASGAFLAGYDAAGNYLWTTQYSADAAMAVAVDSSGILAISGQASSIVNFGGGWLIGDGNPNYYVATFNLSGTSAPAYRWAKRGASGKTWGRALAFDSGGKLLTGGNVQDTGDLGGVKVSGPIGFGAGFIVQYAE